MNDTETKAKPDTKQARDAARAKALRANLLRRKAQNAAPNPDSDTDTRK